MSKSGTDLNGMYGSEEQNVNNAPKVAFQKIGDGHLAHRFTSSGGEIRGEALDIGSLRSYRNPICGACPG